jgi:hypothetical protein
MHLVSGGRRRLYFASVASERWPEWRAWADVDGVDYLGLLSPAGWLAFATKRPPAGLVMAAAISECSRSAPIVLSTLLARIKLQDVELSETWAAEAARDLAPPEPVLPGRELVG